MFDIKTEAASPAASKEEEEDEDEVDWGRGDLLDWNLMIENPSRK